MADPRSVHDAQELRAALAEGASDIEVVGTVAGMPRAVLPPGTRLHGGRLEFGAAGIELTRDCSLEDVEIIVPEHETAIRADTSQDSWGTLTLRGVTTVGQVAIIASDAVHSGRVIIDGLTVRAADLRGRVERPRGFGVEAMQGALTVWNRQSDPAVVISAEITDVSVGSDDSPVRGSGVFVGGHGSDDGRASGGALSVSVLSTGEIVTDGGIAPGTSDLISGGVFVISGAVVGAVTNDGPVTTHGQNDMVLDNWGDVKTWTARAPLTSYGPSGIGVVNFSDIGTLEVTAPVETFGAGARGFNLYDGTLIEAAFASIATHGDGSIGVQLSRPLPTLIIDGDLTTEGGEGPSLIKGVQTTLKAVALSVKEGGGIEVLEVGGQIRTAGDDVVSVDLAATVGSWTVRGGIVADGPGSDAVHHGKGVPAPSGVSVSSAHGRDVVEVEGD